MAFLKFLVMGQTDSRKSLSYPSLIPFAFGRDGKLLMQLRQLGYYEDTVCVCTTCEYTPFSTVYQHDRRLITKGCLQWNPVYVK